MFGQKSGTTSVEEMNQLIAQFGSPQALADSIYDSIKNKGYINPDLANLLDRTYPNLLPADWFSLYESYWYTLGVPLGGVSTAGSPTWAIFLLVGAALFIFFRKKK